MSHDHDHSWRYGGNKGSGGIAYFLGVIGAAVYFVPKTHTFWAGIVALGKALVWPAFLVYSLLRYFHA